MSEQDTQHEALVVIRRLYHALVGVALHGVDDDDNLPSPLQAFCDDGWLCEHAECIEAREAMVAADHHTSGEVRRKP